MSDQSSPESFPITDQNRVRQVAKRGQYDKQTVYQILDAALIGHVAFSMEGRPMQIPMMFARQENRLLFHGSTKSRLMNAMTNGQSVSISVATVDGLVLARSVFHHSMNYRSVVTSGAGTWVDDADEKLEALRILSEKVMPGRWDDARQPNVQELKATRVVAIEMEIASAKVRTGPPVDDDQDMEFPVWAGVVPIRSAAEAPIEDGGPHELPEYVKRWSDNYRG